ncbi:MAG: polysaccharide deacetylase family protein [Clostridia bacterium]|nr:polysaccharide deacetylase family protein [Clostridia bacterium]
MSNDFNSYDDDRRQKRVRQYHDEGMPRSRGKSSGMRMRYRTLKNGFIAVCVILTVLVALSGLFYYKSYMRYQDDITEHNRSLTELKDKLTEKQKELDSKQGELDSLKEQYAKTLADLEALKKEKESQNKQEPGQKEKESEQQETGEKIAYLTFDDGVSKNTPELLDMLDKYGVKATFFPNWKAGYKDYYKLILEKGHALGNHTATHEWESVYSTLEGFKKEVKTLEDNVYEVTGFRPTLFRFPGGTNNTKNFKYNGKNTQFIPAAIDWLTSQGYSYFDWNVSSGDAEGVKYTPDQIAEHVLSGAKGKQTAIILMHDAVSKHTTIEALPKIIEGLKAQGFTFKVLTKDSKQIHFKPAQ